MLFELTKDQQRFYDIADGLAEKYLKPRADEVDRTAEFPRHNFDELAKSGLFGLRIPEEHGGMGADAVTAVIVIERLARACGSTAMCFKMHCESTEPIWQLATKEQVERFVKPIARGKKLVTSAISEAGAGSHTWALQNHMTPAGDGYDLTEIRKGFVTSSEYADFFMTPALHSKDAEPGEFTCFILDKDELEWSVDAPWGGVGMRANASSPMTFKGHISVLHRLGDEKGWGAQVSGPYFLPFSMITFAAVFLGIAEGAFDECMGHVTGRIYPDSGQSLSKIDGIQRYLGEMRIAMDQTRAFLYEVARMVDRGDVANNRPLIEVVCAADETAISVTNAAMNVGGGKSYGGANSLGRYFRDGAAGRIMAPSDDVIKLRVARNLLGLPQF